MTKDIFEKVAICKKHPDYQTCIQRPDDLYPRKNDIRSPFARDYNRILHCTAYRRLKHKTQVFFATTNDHVCTRMEHVNHVTAVSYTIAKYLGLNTELTNAIALGHDLGHAPFGHAGETILKEIIEEETGETFWHERNSLRFVDDCETLEDPQGNHWNLALTYAVRDGIISHCGEVDETSLKPRKDAIDLKTIGRPSEYSPYTWEGCVVKISDKIAYLGRDIEDAISLKILSKRHLQELKKAVKPYTDSPIEELNTTVIMHDFIMDICENSSPRNGICLSPNNLALMKALKEFNCDRIYNHWKIKNYQKYAKLVIGSIFEMLARIYKKDRTLEQLSQYADIYPTLHKVFREWLEKYSILDERDVRLKNRTLYDLRNKNEYILSIVDFISGMTDYFAIKLFNETITF